MACLLLAVFAFHSEPSNSSQVPTFSTSSFISSPVNKPSSTRPTLSPRTRRNCCTPAPSIQATSTASALLSQFRLPRGLRHLAEMVRQLACQLYVLRFRLPPSDLLWQSVSVSVDQDALPLEIDKNGMSMPLTTKPSTPTTNSGSETTISVGPATTRAMGNAVRARDAPSRGKECVDDSKAVSWRLLYPIEGCRVCGSDDYWDTF
ncbi:unnamed protein product [Protopolystoma xenopodis]|uniref:Uncharacterized protein n=1 Tax=Protopolystoma xenopodis TaxID=117903 RepID=A0A448XBL7_9PLAT|nr:unnamed protein product [Protopolystoma xenopodis]